METIGFIGGGNMAEALIKGIISAGLCRPKNVFVSDVRTERLKLLAQTYKITPIDTNAALVEKAGFVVLSVKPQNMAEVLRDVKDVVGAGTVVISIAAGVRVAKIAGVLGDIPIVRVMPNTPALIGQGISALFANTKARPILENVARLFSSVGKTVVVDNEDLIDIVTAVSGSGPAYYFLLMEEMIKTATQLGMPETVAKDLVLQTAKGAGLLAAEAAKNNEEPALLRRKVTSPGGTTEAALKVFAEHDFSRLVLDALTAARNRSKELSA